MVCDWPRRRKWNAVGWDASPPATQKPYLISALLWRLAQSKHPSCTRWPMCSCTAGRPCPYPAQPPARPGVCEAPMGHRSPRQPLQFSTRNPSLFCWQSISQAPHASAPAPASPTVTLSTIVATASRANKKYTRSSSTVRVLVAHAHAADRQSDRGPASQFWGDSRSCIPAALEQSHSPHSIVCP